MTAPTAERHRDFSPASLLMMHFVDWFEENAPGPNASLEYLVEVLCGAPPAAKKVLLEAIGKAMIAAEVERQATRKTWK